MEHKKVKCSVLFWIRKGRAIEQMAPLYCRVTIRGQRYEIPLNCKINTKKWNPSAQRVKGKSDEERKVNQLIDDTRLQVEQTISQLAEKGREISITNFRSFFETVDKQYSTISRLFDYHEIVDRKNLRPGSFRGYIVTKKHVMQFIRIRYHTTDYDIENIDKAFVTGFFAYLQGFNRPGTIRCQVNGALKHLTRLKRVMNLALQNEWINRNPVCLVTFKKTKVEKGFLTEEEVKAIHEIELPPGLGVVRDIFLFSVYTGAAYIDVLNMSCNNLQKGIDGTLWLEYARQKTNQRVTLPLLDPALKIIERYRAYHNGKTQARLFPVPPNQVVNRYLKRIAALAGIDKRITFHMARHTFATTITLTHGIPIETVSRMLGHADLSTTQIYAKIVDKKILDDMKELKTIYSVRNDEEKKQSV